MDIQYAPFVAVALVPVGYLGNYLVNLGKRQTASEAKQAATDATVDGITTTLADLKRGQDLLISKLIPSAK